MTGKPDFHKKLQFKDILICTNYVYQIEYQVSDWCLSIDDSKMNMPALPTDALYKFVTVIGIFGLVYFIVHIDQTNKEDYQRGREFLTETVNYVRDSVDLSMQIERKNSQLQTKITACKKYSFPKSNVEQIDINKRIQSFESKEKRDLYSFIYEYKEEIFPYFKYQREIKELREEIFQLEREKTKKKIAYRVYILKFNMNERSIFNDIENFFMVIFFIAITAFGLTYWGMQQVIADTKDFEKMDKI